MHKTQGQAGCGAKTAYSGTDWQALEVQLNRTRNILQDILVHLQEVLRNLKMARHGGRGYAASETDGSARYGAKDSRFRSQATGPSQHARAQRPHPSGPTNAAGQNGTSSRPHASGPAGANGTAGRPNAAGAGGSEWFRTRNRQGFDARTETGRTATGPEATSENSRFRTAAGSGEQARPGDSRSFRAGASAGRTHTMGGQTGRERPRAESTFRATAGPGAANAGRETRQGHAAGQSSAHAGRAQARPNARTAAGFRLDQDRQSRARKMARQGGMNLKCAYDILCLDYPCTVDEIKIAYRHMARLYHPDLGGDEEAMKDVNVAYELAMRFCAGPRRASTAWAV